MTPPQSAINVNITFRNIEATEALKTYVSEKVTNCLRKYVKGDIEAFTVLLVEKNRQIAELSVHANGGDFNVKEESGNMYSSIDALIDSLAAQLRKHKEKITSHH